LLPEVPLTNPAQITWPTAPVWLAGIGLIALLVLVLLAAYIVRMVVCKARAEDLPAVLAGMSQVLEAVAGMLPWGRPRSGAGGPEGLILAQQEGAPEATEPRTVMGSVVIVQTAATQSAVALPAGTGEEQR
jgi:hypothetical protein